MTMSPSSSEDSTPRPGAAPRAGASPPEDDELSFDVLRNRLGTGDEAAFERIFRRLSEPVFRFVCGMVQDEALAHDITQDTFAKLWSIRDRMDTVDSLRAYVFQMARNRVYNHQRDEAVRRDHEQDVRDAHPDASPPAPDETLDADLLRSLLERWIAELPARPRDAFPLRRPKDLRHHALAYILDVSPPTVTPHIVRALRPLPARLGDYRPAVRSEPLLRALTDLRTPTSPFPP